ncbi:D-ribose pyranase [Priestia taiwanensis]|uniref:D-ribose pyranase n=1 Tax=Priestia taiwanensis TaxID=1347902 RepID=A0A917EL07_9BACI|nr:D-ribose pyranase [Priestia taiwanensis]MBM7361812.1 D-ribose pyranase [Priestia taiwanensis]GGE57156.1 D-ribose pyranase [Priestia taiwanensis]
MKKSAVINSHVSAVIANMAHNDKLSIGDAGMPVPNETPKIDLALTKDIPRFMAVLENVLTELCVERVILAHEIKEKNPAVLEAIKEVMGDTPISFVDHEEMKEDLKNCKAFIRTGEMTPYANIILCSGVVF